MRSLVENENISHKKNLSTRYRHEVAPSDFVPDISLSPYVIEQYQALRLVDTITVDPHKAGFCVYPSGALCYRNGSMRNYIALAAPEVYHGEDDPSVGVYGLEGSKPGAAATSVLLSHNVSENFQIEMMPLANVIQEKVIFFSIVYSKEINSFLFI